MNIRDGGPNQSIPRTAVSFKRTTLYKESLGQHNDGMNPYRHEEKLITDPEQNAVAVSFLLKKKINGADLRYLFWVFDKDQKVKGIIFKVLAHLMIGRIDVDRCLHFYSLTVCDDLKQILEMRNEQHS